jgi:hypothetical protein
LFAAYTGATVELRASPHATASGAKSALSAVSLVLPKRIRLKGAASRGHPAVHRDTCALHALAMARSCLGPDLDPHSRVTAVHERTDG